MGLKTLLQKLKEKIPHRGKKGYTRGKNEYILFYPKAVKKLGGKNEHSHIKGKSNTYLNGGILGYTPLCY